MPEAAIPKNEKKRLSKLRSLHILDTPIEERFERITRIVCSALNVPISAISFVDEDRQWFKSIQGLNVSETPRCVAFCAHAILDNRPLVVENTLQDERFRDNELVTKKPHIRAYAGQPIEFMGENLGTLCAIDRAPKKFTETELLLLRDLTELVKSELASIFVSEAHGLLSSELDKAKKDALIDPLTRLWNRRGADKFIAHEWETAKRSGEALSIALLDIDHFKTVNDTYGHKMGDTCLSHFSKKVIQSIRTSDILCRWGGEEFILLLPKCRGDDLASTLERIHAELAISSVKNDSENIQLSCSIGACTVYPKLSQKGLEHAIQLADDCLYRAKSKGRAQYIIAPEQNEQKFAEKKG
jgi:diguanylate cyclase (GGDEF)-like protein